MITRAQLDAEVAAQMQSPDDLPPVFLEMVREYEEEMDGLWPHWRKPPGKQPAAPDWPFEKTARFKWLLKRRELLLCGRDWAVRIHRHATGRPFCVPFEAEPGLEPRREHPKAPKPWRSTLAASEGPSLATVLARETGQPLEAITTLLTQLPDGTNPRWWVTQQLRTRKTS